MTVRSIEAKYQFLDEATPEDLAALSDDPMAQMMNDIEGVIAGHCYEDVYGALALILVNAAKEENADPQMVLGQINLHMSAAWTMVMGTPDHMTMN